MELSKVFVVLRSGEEFVLLLFVLVGEFWYIFFRIWIGLFILVIKVVYKCGCLELVSSLNE